MTPNSADPIEISVVIVNYNVRTLLENCLHSMEKALEGIASEIIVVDNNSDDGSVEMLRERFADVHVIESATNDGFAKANNRGLAVACGRFLLLLNPDTIAQEDTVRVMLRFFEAHPDAGLAGCRILRPDGTFYPACRRSFPSPWVAFTKLSGLSALFPKSRLFGRYNLTFLDERETYAVDAISGSFMMFPRAVLDVVHGLDESYFMYGEDLDFCHRVMQAGWRVYYVHETTIIHYAGESTKRSDLDAKAVFYRAMEIFARKHLRLSRFSMAAISVAITVRLLIARSRNAVFTLASAAFDAALVVASMFVAEYIRYGRVFQFPGYAYPTIYLVTAAVFLSCLAAAGAYRASHVSAIRVAVGVIAGFVILSSLTYFFKDYAFSRLVVAVTSAIVFVLVPGRRIYSSMVAPALRRNIVTGNPTLLVGRTAQALEILRRLQRYDASTYRVVGLVDVDRRDVGERFGGVPVVGSIDALAKLVREYRITDVIFIPEVLSYARMLEAIRRARTTRVQFRIVPKSLDFIVGKAGVDELTSVPLVDVDFRLFRPAHRAFKRLFDVVLAAAGMVLLPIAVVLPRPANRSGVTIRGMVRALPSVLSGRRSLVGRPDDLPASIDGVELGRPGLTGLVQLRRNDGLSLEEERKLALQYVRNQSLTLDMEILLRTCILCLFGKAR